MNDGAQPRSECLPGYGLPPHIAGMTPDLTDDEAAALARYLRQALDHARYPYAPRLDPLKAILAKLDPPPPYVRPPPLEPGMGPSHGQHRRRR
jgi:hypothetical protein